MNVVITLPRVYIDKILNGEKTYEMRHSRPKHLRPQIDGFFCVEKGTSKVICWCKVDCYVPVTHEYYDWAAYGEFIGCSKEYWDSYVNSPLPTFLWRIGEIVKFEKPLNRDNDLMVEHNPQQFAYCHKPL